MVRDPAVDTVIEKWRAHWPEWPLAEPFVPPLHRERALAWFALRDELTHAAWSGSDPRPGEAKLAWWGEELQGWRKGARRHPLGNVLQPLPAAWSTLAWSLPTLLASRERAGDTDEAVRVIEPFAESVASVAQTVFGSGKPAPMENVALGLLAERVLEGGDAAAPLEFVAKAGEGAAPNTAARACAAELLARWPAPHDGSVAGRLHASLVRERLQRFAKGGVAGRPLPAWRALFTSWQAARR
jgi:hypothetical protein